MSIDKLTLLRDESKDSERVSKMLNDSGIKFREVFSDSERIMPCLIVPGHAYSYRGYTNILEYVNSLNPTKKNSQSYQE